MFKLLFQVNQSGALIGRICDSFSVEKKYALIDSFSVEKKYALIDSVRVLYIGNEKFVITRITVDDELIFEG